MKISSTSEFGKRLLFLLDVSVFYMYLALLYINKIQSPLKYLINILKIKSKSN